MQQWLAYKVIFDGYKNIRTHLGISMNFFEYMYLTTVSTYTYNVSF